MSEYTKGKLSLNDYHYPYAYLVIRKGSEDNDAFPRPRKICDVTLDGKTEEEYQANAKRLVKCWNCHDELVAIIQRYIDYRKGADDDIDAIAKEMEAALANARKS